MKHEMSKRGFSLVEVVVAMTVATLIIMIAYNAVILMVKSEKSISRDSLRAMTESTLMQALLMDVRSSHKDIDERPAGTYRIVRWVLPPGGVGPSGGGALVEQVVTWTVDKEKQRVRRSVPGEDPVEFSFADQLDPRSVAFSLRIEREGDVLFAP